MQTTATYFVYGPRAYRGEISLYRHEGVTAAHAEPVEAPVDIHELWRTEREDSGPVFTHDAAEGFRAFLAGGAYSLSSIAIID